MCDGLIWSNLLIECLVQVYALRLQFYPEMVSKPLPARATELESDVAQCEPAAVPDLDDSAILLIQQQTEGDKPHTVTQQPTGKQ